MAIQLKSKPGITGANVLAIPKDWDPVWFRHFVNNQLKGADVRNAIGAGGITVSGNISSPYATITGSGVTQIIAGTNITISPPGGTGVVTINSSGGGGGGGFPSTLANLVFWFQGDLLIAGATYPIIQNSAPTLQGYNPLQIFNDVISVVSTLNSKNVATFTTQSEYILPGLGIAPFTDSTIFVVINAANAAGNPAIFGSSPNGCYELFINATSALSIVVQGTAVIGASTAPLTLGTWFQANASYASASGPWEFRQSRTAAGSGSLAHSVTLGVSGVCCAGTNAGGASGPLSAQIAEMIVYNRVLSPTEKVNVENYLFAKWGV